MASNTYLRIAPGQGIDRHRVDDKVTITKAPTKVTSDQAKDLLELTRRGRPLFEKVSAEEAKSASDEGGEGSGEANE